MRFIVLAPELEPELAFSLRSCVALDSRSTATICESDTLATESSLEPIAGAPLIRFDAPEDATGDERMAVHASVCPAGESLPSADARTCSGGGETLFATIDFSMDDGAHPNGFEWCINQPAIDADGVVYANAEDGRVYSLPQGNVGDFTVPLASIFLEQAIGAAYTPLALAADGMLYTQNFGHLFAIGE